MNQPPHLSNRFIHVLAVGVLVLIITTPLPAQWVQKHGPHGGHVRSLHNGGSYVLTGLYQGGVYRSTDAGQNWSSSSAGLPANVLDIRKFSQSPAHLYAASFSGLYTSDDEGQTWSLNLNDYCTSVVAQGGSVYVGSNSGVYVSTDEGSSWSLTNNGLTSTQVTDLTFGGSMMFAVTSDSGIYISTNNGADWTRSDSGVTATQFQAVIANDSVAFAGAIDGVYRSRDQGISWQKLMNSQVASLDLVDTTVYAGLFNLGVSRSTDNGATWADVSTFYGSVSAVEAGKDTVYAGNDGGLYFSTNSGTSWSYRYNGLDAGYTLSLASSNDSLYAGTDQLGVFFSTDAGTNWTSLNPNFEIYHNVPALAVHNGVLLAGLQGYQVWRTTDNGANWNSSATGSPYAVVNVIRTRGSEVYAGDPGGVFVSTDDGASWDQRNSGLVGTSVRDFAFYGDTIFVSASNIVYRSTDDGMNWSETNSGLEGQSIDALAAIGNTIFAATHSNGIFRSTDNGQTWSNPGGSVSAFSMATSGKAVFAAANTQVSVSTNGGTSWKDVSGGLVPPAYIPNDPEGLVVHQSSLMLATSPGGVWAAPLDALIPPDMPQLLSAVPDSAQASLTWSSVSDADLLRYRVYYGLSTNPTVPLDSTADGSADTSLVITGLAESTTYYVRVTAVDSSGNVSDYSNEISFTTPDATPPSAPQNLMVTDSSSGMGTFRWTRPPEADVAFYAVYFGTSPGPAVRVDSTTSAADTVKTITGLTDGTQYYVRVTAIDSAGNESTFSNEETFTPHVFGEIAAGLPGVGAGYWTLSNAAWGDYDNDGDLDLLLTGAVDNTTNAGLTKLFRNDGGTFVEVSIPIPPVYLGSVAWGDYDNDGDLDILISGMLNGGAGNLFAVYRNDGGTFVDASAGLPLRSSVQVSWGDYDNDGDLDILSAGSPTEVFRNDNGTFTQAAVLPNAGAGFGAWGDYDGDGDLDIALAGTLTGSAAGNVTRVYRNDGGTFVDIQAGLHGVNYGSLAWGDYDEDGDPDLVVTGQDTAGYPSASIYRNDAGTFVEIASGISGVTAGGVAWGDYDNDGHLDLLLSGALQGGLATRLYHNTGGTFVVDSGAGLPPNYNGLVAWGDYDNDGYLDILMTGMGLDVANHTRVLRNTLSGNPNTVPSEPSILGAITDGTSATLSWHRGADAETAPPGLSYNLRIDTTLTGQSVMPAMADVNTGARRIPSLGNVQMDTSWTVNNLPAGKYYWSVQSIDNAFAGSPFSPVDSFVIKYPVVTLSWGTASIGPVRIWRFRDSTVTITNAGTDTLKVDSIIVSNDAFSARTTQFVVPPGQFFVDTVRFAPAKAGPDSANVQVYGNLPAAPLSFVVNGLGVPAPTITSVTPPSGPPGTPVEIKGSAFAGIAEQNLVSFGGVDAVVTAATETTLAVLVPENALPKPVTVTAGGLTGSSSVPFVLTFTGGGAITTSSFSPKKDVTITGFVREVVATDLDRDGWVDLVATHYGGGSHETAILRNRGNGTISDSTFEAPLSFSTGNFPIAVDVGDLDGDGRPDIVVGSYNSSSVEVLHNVSTPGTLTASSFETPFALPAGINQTNVHVVDVDADGRPDILSVNQSGSSFTVWRNISRGEPLGPGSFAPVQTFTGIGNCQGLAMGDLDGDGRLDLAFGSTSVGSMVTGVARNLTVPDSIKFDSSFTMSTLGTVVYNVAIGDIDGDGKPDLAASGQPASITIRRNVAAAGILDSMSFQPPVGFTAGDSPTKLVITDLNGDTKPEIAAVNEGDGTVSVFTNTSTLGIISGSSFSAKVDFPVGNGPRGMTIADIDRDGRWDIVAANESAGTLSILRNVQGTVSSVEDEAAIPTVFSLSQNYPNPFNPSTTIRYGVPVRSHVRLILYNVIGQEVGQLADEEVSPGFHAVIWNAPVASGVYFYRMTAESLDGQERSFVEVKKLVLVR